MNYETPLTKEDSYQPSATTAQMGHEKARTVGIDQLDFGYIVRVGCQSFAIQSIDVVIEMLNEYLHTPSAVEAKWRAGELKIG